MTTNKMPTETTRGLGRWRGAFAPERPTHDHLCRTDKDFAIEFGEYLATAADRMIAELRRESQERDGVNTDVFRGLQDAIYEFRKRAAKAREISDG